MRSAVLVDVAQAVTKALNEHDFGLSFTAQRSYADFDELLEDLDCLHVDVVPVQHDEADLNTRGSFGYRVSVDIGIRKRLSAPDPLTGRIALEDLDRLVLLVEQFHEYLAENRELSNATWFETKIRSTYFPPDLRQNRQFTSIIRATYDATVAA